MLTTRQTVEVILPSLQHTESEARSAVHESYCGKCPNFPCEWAKELIVRVLLILVATRVQRN